MSQRGYKTMFRAVKTANSLMVTMNEDDFAPPAFKPTEALVLLKRQLLDLHALVERGDNFMLRGITVLELTLNSHTIVARLAKRPARTPEWVAHTLKSNADLRRFMDGVKRQRASWADE